MTVKSMPFAKEVKAFTGPSTLFQEVERGLSQCNNRASIEDAESLPTQDRKEGE